MIGAVTLASFLSSGTQHAILNGLVFFAFVLWLSLGYWTYKDARRRIEDPLLVGMATLLALVLPYLGPFIYMLFRPPEYLEDVRERELEIKAMEDRLSKRDLHCPVCRSEVDSSYPRLPDLHDEAQAVVRDVQGAARGAVAGMPVLRDADRVGGRRAAGAATRRRGGAAVQLHLPPRGSAANTHPDQARCGTASPRRRDPQPDRGARFRDPRGEAADREPRARARRTTRSTRRSRSTASSSTSSRRARPGRSSSRARARSRRCARRSARRIRPTPIRARSAATSRCSMPDNLVHGSDSPESAEREIALWFSADELG